MNHFEVMNFYPGQEAIRQAPFGYAYHKVLPAPEGAAPEYVFAGANAAFEKMAGLSVAELVDRNITDVLSDMDWESFDWVDLYRQVAEQDETIERQRYCKMLKRWYKVLAYSPEADCFCTVFVDITCEKQQFEARKPFFAANAELFCVTDLEGGFINVNNAWQSLLGYGPQMLENGRNFLEFVHPDDVEVILSKISNLTPARPNGSFVSRFRSKDGSDRFIDWRVCLSGKHLYAAGRDITERRRAEKALAESEEKFRLIFEYAPLGIFRFDATGRINACNESFVQIMGGTRKALIGLDLLGLPDKAVVAAIERALQGRTATFEGEYLSVTGGKRIPLRACFNALFSEDGEIEGGMGIIEDVTEAKQAEAEREKLEAQFRQAQRMESVGKLAGGVAHDFNNMLSIINGYAEIALNCLTPSDALYSSMKEIMDAGQRSAGLVRQLLAFARQQTIAPVQLDLNDTVGGMLKMLNRLIGEDIELAWQPADDLWPVKMDPSQVDQILANLAVNARDAITDVGKMAIETANVEIDKYYCQSHAGFLPGKFVMIAVSDNGCGMEKHSLEHLFEPFFTTKAQGEGTGLGLATVYGIVKQNKGFINVYSEPGQGTTFKIYLPAHQACADDEKLQTKPAALPKGTETILLVEDEKTLINIIQELLQGFGYTVLTASTPAEAIRVAEAHPASIDLLMTDVIMPGMNGRDLAETLLAKHPALRCLFMSGYTANVIAQHGVLEEGVQFIQKPFTINDIATKVRRALQADLE
ncbi:MAG: PAS domain S-box protein [Thermodesulfobacteriota bacterium]